MLLLKSISLFNFVLIADSAFNFAPRRRRPIYAIIPGEKSPVRNRVVKLTTKRKEEREKKRRYLFENKKTNQNWTFRPKIIHRVFKSFESAFKVQICFILFARNWL